MWLDQKIYSFLTERNIEKEDFLNRIFLKVNENLTDVKLTDLFIKLSEDVEFDEDTKLLELKGYSILEFLGDNRTSFPTDKGDINLSFYSEELGEIKITKIENPWFQADEKQIADSEVEKFKNKIIELSIPKKDDNQGEGVSSPHPDPSLFNKKYENNKIRFINNGYKEFSFGNFKVLKKIDVLLVFEIMDANTAYKVDAPAEKVMDNFYKMDDEDSQRTLNIKFIDDKLHVEPIYKEFTD